LLYIDLHDPQSRAQIHTQPMLPLIDVLGQKLMSIVFEGDATKRASEAIGAIIARRAAAVDPCGHPTEDESPSTNGGERLPMDWILARKPRAGRFTTEGWVQLASHCSPCAPGATCKPCEEVVWLSSSFGAFKDGLTRDHDLVVTVPDARHFDMLGHYRVTFVACIPPTQAPLHAELRGFERLP
jgi:hypothetical protein